MKSFLSRPYPFENTLSRRLVVAVCVSIFVFLFLFLFQPFGLSMYRGSILKLTLGYGLVSFSMMMCINLVILFAFPDYFKEEKWTTGKEILWFMVMFATIGMANSVYTGFAYMGIFALSWKHVLIFEGYTLAVGIFPVSLSIILNQVRLNSTFEKASSELNEVIEHKPKSTALTNQQAPVTIVAENGKDQFKIQHSHILFIKAADNYVEVFYRLDDQTRCELIRTTLKKCDELLSDYPSFFRCHKSYLVNLEKVSHVSGNAQGYKLHLGDTEERVPVSRAYNEIIKTRLADRP